MSTECIDLPVLKCRADSNIAFAYKILPLISAAQKHLAGVLQMSQQVLLLIIGSNSYLP